MAGAMISSIQCSDLVCITVDRTGKATYRFNMVTGSLDFVSPVQTTNIDE